MHQNVSVIQALVASCLDFSGKRNRVVYTDQEFPSNMYVWEGMRSRGAKIVTVPTEGVEIDVERILDEITEETAIVPISLVQYKTNFLLDAKAVCEKARSVGAIVMLDAYQATGTVPIDVRALGVDMVCGGSVKWLCGGPGAAYLYVRPDLLPKMEPRITGWAAHEEPFAFETGPQRYAHDVRRMLHGTPSVAAFLAATAGYEIVLEAGVEAIRAHSIRLTEKLRQDLLAAGFPIHSPVDPARRGSTLTVGLRPDENGPAFVKALEERGILVDHRPGAGIRASPHFYTLEEELEEFVETLVELREKRRWQSHVAATSRY
jgi:kynureninase